MDEKVTTPDPYYNTVPETRGTARTKGTFTGPTGRDLEDAAKLAAWRAQKAKNDNA